MALSDILAARLAGPAGRVLDGPIREIVQRMLQESGYASPAEVQSLRDEARDLRGRIDAVDRRAGELANLLQVARGEVDRARADAQRAADAAVAARAAQEAPARGSDDPRVDALIAEVATLRAALAARPTEAAAPEAQVDRRLPPVSAAPRGVCKVPDCGAPVRSKGFCSAHYQQWRRGTLRGFVTLDGLVELDEESLTLPAVYAGGHATRVDGVLHVDGQPVEA